MNVLFCNMPHNLAYKTLVLWEAWSDVDFERGFTSKQVLWVDVTSKLTSLVNGKPYPIWEPLFVYDYLPVFTIHHHPQPSIHNLHMNLASTQFYTF